MLKKQHSRNQKRLGTFLVVALAMGLTLSFGACSQPEQDPSVGETVEETAEEVKDQAEDTAEEVEEGLEETGEEIEQAAEEVKESAGG